MLLSRLLDGRLRPGIFRVANTMSLAARDALINSGLTRTLTAVSDKPSLLAEFSRLFDFPSYFGNNWDALTDCLSDLNWKRPLPDRIILVWTQPMSLHDAHADDFFTTLEILNHVADRWWSDGVPFYVLLEDSGQAVPLRALPPLFVDMSFQ